MQKEFYTLAEIANIIGATLQGNPDTQIFGVAPLAKAKEGQLSFLTNSRYQLAGTNRHEKSLQITQASAVILPPKNEPDCPVDKLIVANPHEAYVMVAKLFEPKQSRQAGIHPTAIVGMQCDIAQSVTIGPYCVIGDHCKIGDETVIDSHTVIGPHTQIGSHCHLHPRVTLYHQLEIGNNVVIHSGAVIGREGFGLIRSPQGWKKIPHLATVIINDDVEVGANTTVDRGALENTVLGKGVKLDNLIQVGHGVVIGEHTVIAGCVAIGGSTQIGKNCMSGGLTGISDNLVIGDNVIFTGMSQVTKSIPNPGVYSSGTSILPQKKWHKNIARLHKLDDIARKIKKLEEKE